VRVLLIIPQNSILNWLTYFCPKFLDRNSVKTAYRISSTYQLKFPWSDPFFIPKSRSKGF